MAKGQSPQNKGKIKIHNDKHSFYIKKEELEKYLKLGYKQGNLTARSEEHKQKLASSHKGKTSPRKGICLSEDQKTKIANSQKGLVNVHKPGDEHSIRISSDRLDEYISNGYVRGLAYKRGMSDEARVNVSHRMRGRTLSDEHKQKIGNANRKPRGPMEPENKAKFLAKQFDTKRKNKSFNTSNVEKQYYKQLLKKYPNKTILTQYKEERYPYYCDFYIVEDDLFIELNAHWTHGPAAFNSEDETHIELLNIWKEKSKQSKFYENAIKTWTERDVEKKKCAEENHLNYLVLYEDYQE